MPQSVSERHRKQERARLAAAARYQRAQTLPSLSVGSVLSPAALQRLSIGKNPRPARKFKFSA